MNAHRVQIGRVRTGWLPVSRGEQVAVFAPFGEFAQAFVLRSIHYNNFPAPTEQNTISVNAKSDVKVAGEGECKITFQNGFEITVCNVSFKISDSRISLNCGSSSIDISEDSIVINSGSITTIPSLCMCNGEL